MRKRTRCLLAFVLLVTTMGGLWMKTRSHIDPNLVGEWGVTRNRSWLGFPVCSHFTLAADGTWTSPNSSGFMWPYPLRTWSVSDEEVQLCTTDLCWPSSGSLQMRAEYAYDRTVTALKGGRSLCDVHVRRFRKEISDDNVTMLITIPEDQQEIAWHLQLRPEMDPSILGQWSEPRAGNAEGQVSRLTFYDDGSWTGGDIDMPLGCSLSWYFEDHRLWDVRDDELIVRRVSRIWPKHSSLRTKIQGCWAQLCDAARGKTALIDATEERFRIEPDASGALTLVQTMPESISPRRLWKSGSD